MPLPWRNCACLSGTEGGSVGQVRRWERGMVGAGTGAGMTSQEEWKDEAEWLLVEHDYDLIHQQYYS